MLKPVWRLSRIFKIIISIIIITINYCTTYANGITIDNQLVSIKHDCFERIAIGAMLPFDKTFRNSDTNSYKVCEELCAKEGDQCQTFALGIHVRGNGTCQLSSEIIDSTRARPVGTIFDPDFDLYARRSDCNPTTTDFVNPTSGFPSTVQTRPPLPTSTTVFIESPPSSPPSEAPTVILIQNPSPTNPNPTFTTTTEINFEPSRPSYQERPSSTPGTMMIPVSTISQDGYKDSPSYSSTDRLSGTPSNERYPPQSHQPPSPNKDHDRYPLTDRYPTTETYPPHDKYPSNRYPTKDQYPEKYPNKMRPYNDNDGYTPLDQPIAYPLHQDRDSPRPNYNDNQGFTVGERYPLYEDLPSSYDKNSNRYPNAYGQNKPSDDRDYYRPSRPESYDFQSSLYSGGSSSTSYTGSTISGTIDSNRDKYYYTTNDNIDRYGLKPTTNFDQNPVNNGGYNNRPSNSNPQYGNGYTNRPSISNSPISSNNNGYQDRPDGPPSVNRPDPISTDNGYSSTAVNGGSTSSPTSSPISSGYGTNNAGGDNSYSQNLRPSQRPSSQPGGNYHVTEEPIEIYFNPDSYYTTKPKPGEPLNNDKYGGAIKPSAEPACFRRVLAGKRVAPQWVRRTLACETVEDCQRECGGEQRFSCEGFNYRLDPSGHGQGICELLEVPLSELDVYSNAQHRDTILIRHPDYDYYERDRNASPGCSRPPPACVDCSYLKPSIPLYRPSSPNRYKPYPEPIPSYESDRYRPQTTAIDKYRPPIYDNRPPISSTSSGYNSYDYQSNSQFYQSDHKYQYRPVSEIDRYDPHRPDAHPNYRPGYGEIQITNDNQGYLPLDNRPNDYRPSYKPSQPDYNYQSQRPQYNYLDRDRYGSNQKPATAFIPYQIGGNDNWGAYGGSYGGTYSSQSSYKSSQDYWGIRNELQRVDGPKQFNYLDLGKNRYNVDSENSVWSYPGSRYGVENKNKLNYGSLWTRRPGSDDCSVKSSEGFRLHKGAIKHVYNAPNVRECEQMCFNEGKFKCHTYSYRYAVPNENCLLCDRPYSLLDYYSDLEPDRDYDIYSMSDDPNICKISPKLDRTNNAQCFFRAVDASRFFKSIVRDSLTVRSIGECELECIKSSKFTCRAFTFRYGSLIPGSIIDNCQLSDWPVRDMDKERHLIPDHGFDVFERASYGHGCEIRPIIDTKHQKLCYLGYGSPAKLLSAAIKKVISVPTELECKNECTRYRDTSIFKCFSFSFGAQASSFNCEMSDLDQSELKLNIHYAHTRNRDFWLFAWNPFDWTCRDKVTSIGGGNRVNNDRRMDIFRNPGKYCSTTHEHSY